jgi:PPOX class probable F420-dependent enzyme
MRLSPAAKELLASPALAHYVTLDTDGTPRVAVVWVMLDGEDIVAGHLDANQKKLRNLRNDSRAALSIETDHVNEHGLREYFVAYGTVTLEEGGAADLLQRLAHVYLGPDVKFPPMDNPPAGIVSRLRIERVAGMGNWTTE